MTDLPTIATLWVGGSLSWLERLCLKSFVDAGHHTVLYTYEEVEGVPEGVELRDGRTILEGKPTYKHARSGSVAPFADIFRFHMMQKAPGQIWVDTDIYCWKPMAAEDDHVFGYERARRINSAVLRLPPDSDALGQLLEFMEEEFPIPPFLSKFLQAKYREAAEAGEPVHVSEMPWGLWGPVGLSYFLKQTGEDKFARARTVYYPVPYPQRNILFKKPKKVRPMIAEDTETIHLWSPIKRFAAGRFGGYAPHSSFLWHLLAKHGIDRRAGRITRYGDRTFDHSEFDAALAAAATAKAEADALNAKADAAAERLAALRMRDGFSPPIDDLPEAIRPETLKEAYATQAALRRRLTPQLGEVSGWKIGCTSKVMQDYLGVDHPCMGTLYAGQVRHGGATLKAADYRKLGLECEIAVRMARDVAPGEDPAAAIGAAMCSVEIVEERFGDFSKCAKESLVADDFFSMGCVLGGERDFAEMPDLKSLRGGFRVNGEDVASGLGEAICGDPLDALRWLAETRASEGGLKAGEVATLGSVVKTFYPKPGDRVEARFDGLGGVEVLVV